MELKKEEVNQDNANSVRNLFAKVSDIIEADEKLSSMNFGLFYQDGRLSLVDLDAFAKSTKVRLSKDGEEKSLTELQKNVDKNNE